MFRHQFHVQVAIGEWREFFSLYEKLEQLVAAKNLVGTQLWAVTLGKINGAVLITDYETLEAWDQNTKAFTNDPDLMTVWREMGNHVNEIPWDEMWESAFQVA